MRPVSIWNCGRLQLVLIDRDVVTFAQLIATALVLGIDHSAGLLIDHLLAQAVAGSSVNQMEMCLLGLGPSQ